MNTEEKKIDPAEIIACPRLSRSYIVQMRRIAPEMTQCDCDVLGSEEHRSDFSVPGRDSISF